MTNQPRVVAQAEVTQMLGISRKRVSQLTSSDDFPAPLGALTVGGLGRSGSAATDKGTSVYKEGRTTRTSVSARSAISCRST